MENSKFKLILASASPRRKELLGHLGIPFEIQTKNIPENSQLTEPAAYALEIAQSKGDAVLNELVVAQSAHRLVVVSADTIVCLDGKIYGKPKDKDQARDFLSELSGKTHSVLTAVAITLRYNGQTHQLGFVDESFVTFDPISTDIMEKYLLTGDSLDKAGAYGIQGPSLTFISKVEGSYSNVVGFPLSRFVAEIEQLFKQKFPQGPSWFEHF
jgi:septum formation protein